MTNCNIWSRAGLWIFKLNSVGVKPEVSLAFITCYCGIFLWFVSNPHSDTHNKVHDGGGLFRRKTPVMMQELEAGEWDERGERLV